MLASELMHSGVLTCTPEDSLEEIALRMWNEDCGAIVIADNDNHPLGILTDRDITMAAALKHAPLWEVRAADVKPGAEIYTCHVASDARHALSQMGDRRVRRLVVIDDEGRITGIISTKDLVEHATSASAKKLKALSAEAALSTLRDICRPNSNQAAA